MRIKVHEKQETELSKLVKAYVKAVSGEDAVPDTVTMVSKTPIDDDGSVLIEFEFTGNGPKSADGTTYALVYGDLYTNTDNDLLYFLHDWQSGEKVTPEDIGEHDWVLANDYIRPSEILAEAFGSVDDMLTKDEQKIVLDAYNDALKEALTYIQGALPEGYSPTQLSFGNPFYMSIGTEKPSAGRYDPDRFGPHLFNISVDFIDGDSPKVAFRVDVTDPKTGETTLQRRLVYVDIPVADFLAMKKPAFRLLPSDADKLADATKRAFRKTEAIKESCGYSIGPISTVAVKTDAGTFVAHDVYADGELSAGCGARGEDEFEIDPSHVSPFVEYWTDSDGNEVEETDELLDALCEVLAEPKFDELWKTDAYEGKSEAVGYRVNVAFVPEPPFGYGDQDFLFKGLDIIDEEFSFPSEKEAVAFARDCANRITARNQDLESDGLQDGEIRIYYTNRDYVDRMVRNAGKAYAALWQDYDPENPPFPVLVARITISK